MNQQTRVLHSVAMFFAFEPGGMLQQAMIVSRVGHPGPSSQACTAARSAFLFLRSVFDRTNPFFEGGR